MLSEKALRWSADQAVTSTQLKEVGYQFTGETDDVFSWLSSQQIGACVLDESTYHFKLHRCSSKPGVLYYMGNKELLDQSILAIVWPRKPTSYLTQVTKDLCSYLSQYAVCTISGGAQGIDQLIHRSSLENGIPTIVVLGAGFRRVARSSHRRFLQEIVHHGWLVLSQRKIDQEPAVYTFPQRNRIIATLAEVVFVPWAGVGSWSLITVDFALQYNVPVATVPGSVYDPACAGSNAYLVEKKIQGVTDFGQFLRQYFVPHAAAQSPGQSIELSVQEQQILELLQEQPLDVTGLTIHTGAEVGEVMQLLLHLEMKRLIYCPEPWLYSRK